MAWTAHADEEHMQEHFDDSQTLSGKARAVAELIRKSRHFVAFTGAGISTSAGIPDFRGPQGVWTMRAQGKSATSRTSTTKAFPTAGHMALKGLMDSGHLEFLISQNVDGIHRRSGIPPEKLAELHGNTNLEFCRRCGKEYLRDYRCSGTSVHDHRTGRLCTCGSQLEDSIINFGESLPSGALKAGFHNSRESDLMLVLGSSLTVTPAADMPRLTAESGGGLVVCNLQKTPLDHLCKVRVFAKTDDLMIAVMKELGQEIPQWKLKRYVKVVSGSAPGHPDRGSISVSGEEPDGTPATILSAIQIHVKNTGDRMESQADSCKMEFAYDEFLKVPTVDVELILEFMGHFNEPPLRFQTQVALNVGQFEEKHFCLEFDPEKAEWNVKLLQKSN